MAMEHIDDLADAYVLGALEPDGMRAVETHLASCARCHRLVGIARQALLQLLLAPPPVNPPASLRQKVIDRVRHEAEAGQASTQPHPTVPDLPLPPRRSGLGNLVRIMTGNRDEDSTSDVLARLMADPECHVWDVAGTEAAPGARARFIGVPSGRKGVLVATGLRPLASDQIYQAWLLRDGKPLPNALFRVTRFGTGHLVVYAPGPLSDFGVIAITPEPPIGSSAPTGAIVLAGELR